MRDLTTLSAKELAAGYRAGEFFPVEVGKAYLTKIEKENPRLNAYLEVYDDVLDQAKVAEAMLKEKGSAAHPLCGVPIAVKDNILVEGKVASAASKILENHIATYDATAIKKLKEAGAVFLGRTNMDEFAMGSSTESSYYGPTKNPIDPTRAPGGSSGGSAAAVAAHLAPIALGTDTGGSVRQPASFCGVFGLKPTYGAVSRYGLIAMGSSLDQLGIFARTAKDVEVAFETVRGLDSKDSTTLPEVMAARNTKRIGVPRDFVAKAHPDVVREFDRALEGLKKVGYEVVDVTLPASTFFQ